MNRLIIIGNGFDLAHGLKTSYGDFLYWVKSKIVKSPDEYFEHISLSQADGYFVTSKPKASSFFERYYNGSKNLDEFISSCKGCEFVYKNIFLKQIMKKLNLKNWVDIEEEYLCEINKEITIKEHLKDSMIKAFNEEDKVSTIPTELSKILLLNFNYTSSEKDYEIPLAQTIHIHGELKNEKNPIIFGYGNENTEIYKEIKKDNNKDFLTNMKQFKYFNVSNYKDLMSFVKSAKYQIYIWGHSCGNSDGTLLKELFEDDNCISIKPFYHKQDGSDNYGEIVMNISSHFSNNAVFREKVMNKELCEELK